ncbi:MAG: TIM barrel protein [Bryobacteraceae bacterium]|nr:TIM barrel protein [Bryobacteraceae bacterium]
MRRRRFLTTAAASLAALRGRLAAQTKDDRNLRWAVSMFLWTSTQWRDDGSARFTDMLDVIKDTGFDGFRLTGWPASLDKYNMPVPVLEKELDKRGLRIATISFGGQANDPAQHAQIEQSAHRACQFLQHFGATELVVFSPGRVNKVLVREHLRRACEFYNRLGDLCAGYGIRAGLHNHSQGQLVESQDEVEMLLDQTDPKRFGWAPDTIHLYIGGCDVVGLFEKHGHRLITMDYVDVKYTFAAEDLRVPNGAVEKAGTHNATFMLSNKDLGDGVLDFPALHRVLKRNHYKGWIVVDHHYAPVSPKHSFTRCRQYIREKLESIYY